MFCGNCGCKNDDNAGFCKECGNQLNGNNTTNFNFDQQSDVNSGITIDFNDNQERKVSNIPHVPKKLLGGTVILIVAIIVSAIVFLNIKPTINLDEYVEVSYSGYNGYGNAYVDIDWYKIAEDYESKIKYTNKVNREQTIEVSPIDYMHSYISLSLDKTDNLSNGDDIKYTWNIDEEALSKYLKCKFKYEDKISKVSKLEEVEKFDPFEGLTVDFSGTEPDGSANIEYTGEFLSNSSFSLDKYNNLKNGDVVTAILDNTDNDYYLTNFDKIPSSTSKTFTVIGLSRYIAKLSDIKEEKLTEAKVKTEKFIRDDISNWSNDVKLNSIDYLGYYLEVPGHNDSGYYDNETQNALGFVYKLRSTIHSDEEDVKVDQYYDVKFQNITIDVNGNYHNEDEWDYYYKPRAQFSVDVSYSYGTYPFYYRGYKTLGDLKTEIKSRGNGMDEYNVEMNITDTNSGIFESEKDKTEEGNEDEEIEESDEPEKINKKDKNKKNNDFLWKDSFKVKLTENNVEKIIKKVSKGKEDKLIASRSYARMIINEMYARKGSKFDSPELMKYFNKKAWYKKIKKKVSKEKIKFNKLEQENINILDKYDKAISDSD